MSSLEEKLLGSSPLNLMPEVRDALLTPLKKIKIHDSTLRDGEQTAGVVFNKEDKLVIGKALDAYGVDRIEVMPAVSQDDVEAMQQLIASGISAEVVGFCRALNKDVDKSIEAGCKSVVIEIPGYPRLLDAMELSSDAAVDMFVSASRYAKEKGLNVTGFFMMVTQAPLDFSLRLIEGVIKKNAVDSIAIPDTMGMAMPWAIYHFVKKLKEITDKPIEIHPHNSLNMGTANAVAGVMAGAEVVHTCVNGLGDSGGNAALESVAVALEVMLGMNTNIDFSKTYELSKLVAKITGIPTTGNLPIVGDLAFSNESGIGIDVGMKLLTVKSDYPMFKDIGTMVGRKREIVVGKASGRKSIVLKMLMMGIEQVSEEKQNEILQQVKSAAILHHRAVTEDEFREIIKKVGK